MYSNTPLRLDTTHDYQTIYGLWEKATTPITMLQYMTYFLIRRSFRFDLAGQRMIGF